MRTMTCACLCVLLSGCFLTKQEAKVEPRQTPAVTSDCYTVDLFTPAKVDKPDPTVPEAYRQFLGEWGGGAWNDVWCHDLLITHVDADGRVDLFEMHAPYEPWNQPATAFRRTAQIDRDGNLRFAYGFERLSYRIENGKLVGTRSGMLGDLSVELVRRGVPPIPLPRPSMMAQAAPTPAAEPAEAEKAPVLLAQAGLAIAVPAGVAVTESSLVTANATATTGGGIEVTGARLTSTDFAGIDVTPAIATVPPLHMAPPMPRPTG